MSTNVGSNLRQLEMVFTSCSSSSSTSNASVTDSVAAVVTGTTLSVVVDVALQRVFSREVFFVSKPDGSKGFLKGAELAVAMKEEAGGGDEKGKGTHRGGRTW